MRLFLAIQLSPAVREALLTAQDALRRQGRGSFPPPENLHLTLAFLGEGQRTRPGPGPPCRRYPADLSPWRWAARRGISATCGGPVFEQIRPWRSWPCPCRRTSAPGASARRTAPGCPTSPWSAAGGARSRR